MEIDYIALFVKDVYRSYRFYRDVLEFSFTKEIEDGGIQGKSGQITIGLYEESWYEKLFHRCLTDQDRSVIFAFTTPDLDRFYSHLLAQKVTILQPPTTMPWGQRLCFFADPDGYIWEGTSLVNPKT